MSVDVYALRNRHASCHDRRWFRRSAVVIGCALWLWADSGNVVRGVAPSADGENVLQSGFDHLAVAVQKHQADEGPARQHDDDSGATGGCHRAEEAMRDLIVGMDEARAAQTNFQQAQALLRDQAKVASAIFFEAVAYAELGDMLGVYNQASKNNAQFHKRTLSDAARAYRRSLDILKRVETLPALKPEYQGLVHFYRGEIEISVGRIEAGEKELCDFLSHWKGEPLYAQQAAASIVAGRKILAQENGKGGSAVVPGIPPAPRALRCDSLGIGPLEESDDPCTGPLPQESKKLRPDQVDAPLAPHLAVFVTTGIGVNGNVTTLGRTLPLPATLDGKQAIFNQTTVSAEADWYPSHGPLDENGDPLVDKLAILYSADHLFYDLHHAQDRLAQTLRIDYAQLLSHQWAVELLAADGWLRNDERNLLETFSIQPSISRLVGEATVVRLLFNESHAYNLGPDPFHLQLSGPTHRLGCVVPINVLRGAHNAAAALATCKGLPAQALLTITPTYGHEWTTTQGTIGDRQRDDFLLTCSAVLYAAEDKLAFLRAVTLSGSYEYRRDRYENSPLLTLRPFGVGHEEDDAHLFEATLTLKMWYDERVPDRLDVIFDYKFNRQFSNLYAQDYADPVFLASLKYNF